MVGRMELDQVDPPPLPVMRLQDRDVLIGQARQFLRANYRFDLVLEGDSFRVTAVPTGGGLRPFVGDDSGYIQVAEE